MSNSAKSYGENTKRGRRTRNARCQVWFPIGVSRRISLRIWHWTEVRVQVMLLFDTRVFQREGRPSSRNMPGVYEKYQSSWAGWISGFQSGFYQDQQYQLHLETLEMKTLKPTPDLLNQKPWGWDSAFCFVFRRWVVHSLADSNFHGCVFQLPSVVKLLFPTTLTRSPGDSGLELGIRLWVMTSNR